VAALAQEFGLLGVVCDLAGLQLAFQSVTSVAAPPTSTAAFGDGATASGAPASAAARGGSGGGGGGGDGATFSDLIDMRGLHMVLLYLAITSRYTARSSRWGYAAQLAGLFERLEVGGGREKVGKDTRGPAFVIRFRWTW